MTIFIFIIILSSCNKKPFLHEIHFWSFSSDDSSLHNSQFLKHFIFFIHSPFLKLYPSLHLNKQNYLAFFHNNYFHYNIYIFYQKINLYINHKYNQIQCKKYFYHMKEHKYHLVLKYNDHNIFLFYFHNNQIFQCLILILYQQDKNLCIHYYLQQ